MDHIGEAYPRHLDGKGFDLACPHRGDAIADGCQRETSDPIEKASHRQHGQIRMEQKGCLSANGLSLSAIS